jgi:hypothetical protein
MHDDGIGLAALRQETDSREAQLARAAARAVPAESSPLRVEHFLLNGSVCAFVDVEGTERADFAKVAASLAAIERNTR